MNRHHIKNKEAHWLLKWLSPIVQSSFLLRLRRVMMKFLPFMQLQSQVENIVYLSWLVDIDQVRERYPDSVQLFEKQGKTIFTILTYQHHHFGFSFLKTLRKWMPSPKQSNWRFYISPDQQEKTAFFDQVIVDQMMYVMSGRLASDAMPAQYAIQFLHQKIQQHIQTDIQLDAEYQLQSLVQINHYKSLPLAWGDFFSSWDEAIRYLVDQEHAWVEWVDQPQKLSQGDIEMPFDFDQIQAVDVLNIHCPLFKEWGVNEQDVFAFIVPQVDFHVRNERPLSLDC